MESAQILKSPVAIDKKKHHNIWKLNIHLFTLYFKVLFKMKKRTLFSLLLMPGFIFISCRTHAPDLPAMDEIEWQTYTHPTLKFSLAYPTLYTIQLEGDDVIFQNDGHPSFIIHYCSREEAHKKGLWAGHEPDETVRFAGREWEAYDYDHHDVFFIMRTISFVTPYQDAYLSLDTRTDTDLHAIHQKMIYSFTFL